MAPRIRRPTLARRGKSFRCSFCGKPQHEVRWLVAGQGAYICDACVQLCTESIVGESGPMDPMAVRLKCLREALDLWRHSGADATKLPSPIPEAVLSAAKVFSDFVLSAAGPIGGTTIPPGQPASGD